MYLSNGVEATVWGSVGRVVFLITYRNIGGIGGTSASCCISAHKCPVSCFALFVALITVVLLMCVACCCNAVVVF